MSGTLPTANPVETITNPFWFSLLQQTHSKNSKAIAAELPAQTALTSLDVWMNKEVSLCLDLKKLYRFGFDGVVMDMVCACMHACVCVCVKLQLVCCGWIHFKTKAKRLTDSGCGLKPECLKLQDIFRLLTQQHCQDILETMCETFQTIFMAEDWLVVK